MANHVRIDEGIKRGRRKPQVPAVVREGGYRAALPAKRKAEIMGEARACVVAGHSIEEVAERNGVEFKMLCFWILNSRDSDEIRTSLIDYELARCAQDLDNAPDPMKLAKARERVRFWTWIAERRDADRYGAKQEISINNRDDLGDRLRRSRERTIEGEVVPLAAG